MTTVDREQEPSGMTGFVLFVLGATAYLGFGAYYAAQAWTERVGITGLGGPITFVIQMVCWPGLMLIGH